VTRVFTTYLLTIAAVLLFAGQPCFAQNKKKIKLANADIGTPATRNGKKVTRLVGNVKFKLDDAVLFCDSAFLNDKEAFLEAFGKVRIKQGKVNITSSTLAYSGETKVAQLRKNITMRKEDMTLTTDFLDYNTATKIAYYYQGGKLVSTKNNNTLTSKKGYYNDITEAVLFIDSVLLVNPEYTITSDSLEYFTDTEKVRLLGKSTVTSDNNVLHSNSGWYDTKKEICYFNKRAKVVTAEQVLESDSLYYDRKNGLGKAYNNVLITDTINHFIIAGNYATYNEQTKKMLVTNNMLLTQIIDGDSLLVSGDTLRSYIANPETDQRIFLTYNHVKFYRSDLQGACDSLVFSEQDSAFHMFKDPVLWSEESQLTGDTMHLYLKNKKINELFVPSGAFIASQEDSVSFNQIKGKKLNGYFKDNRIESMKITGNGQVIYYAFEEKKDTTTAVVTKNLIGVNKAECTNILVGFNEGNIQSVGFMVKPHSVLYPIGEVKKEDLQFEDFKWQIDRRPKDKLSLIKD
jgi:lipopolysaccharide assembly outer membrane protein LptD (OstA)